MGNEDFGKVVIFTSARRAGTPGPRKYYYEAVLNVYIGPEDTYLQFAILTALQAFDFLMKDMKSIKKEVEQHEWSYRSTFHT